jgi:hypothetical protein
MSTRQRTRRWITGMTVTDFANGFWDMALRKELGGWSEQFPWMGGVAARGHHVFELAECQMCRYLLQKRLPNAIEIITYPQWLSQPSKAYKLLYTSPTF